MGWLNREYARTRMRDFLKERDDDGYWTAEELNRHFEDGLKTFAREAKCIEACWTIDVQPGKQAYTAPPTMLPGSLRYVQFQAPGEDPERMEYLEERRFAFTYPLLTTGVPDTYTIWRDCVYLGKTPKRYDYAPLRVVASGDLTYILMPNEVDRIDLLANSTTLLGEDTLVVEVVTSSSLGLTGSNKVVIRQPEDQDFVLTDTTSAVGAVEIRLDNYIIYAHLPNDDDVALYSTLGTAIETQSFHGRLHVHGYAGAEPPQDDTDGVEIHDDYLNGPIYYAVAMALMADSRHDEASTYLALYSGIMQDAKLWARRHQFDQLNGIVTGVEELGRAAQHRRNL